jgi:poly-gamma-glutamate synthesis protein (capsule biosynthesis protein)
MERDAANGEQRAEPRRPPPGILRTVARALVAVLVCLALWIAYWTLYDPRVEVPPPLELPFPAAGAADAAKVLFLGDFAPTDRAVPYLARHGFGYPFERTRALLAEHDAVVANLEAPITDSDAPWPLPKEYTYKVAPAATAAIAEAGIDVVTLANNHSHDYGSRGLADTLGNLDRAGIAYLGAALSEAEARRGVVLETAGGRLGILAYLEDKPSWALWTMSYALDAPFRTWPGSARAGRRDLGEDIARLRKLADVVVVVFHFGENYEPVTDGQISLSRAAIDLGADAVIGHHSHAAQPLGRHRGRPIVFSLGNYAWGAIGKGSMRFGMGAALHLARGRLEGIEILPLLVQNRIVEYQPRPPSGKALDAFFAELDRGSKPFGVRIDRRGDRGWMRLEKGLE